MSRQEPENKQDLFSYRRHPNGQIEESDESCERRRRPPKKITGSGAPIPCKIATAMIDGRYEIGPYAGESSHTGKPGLLRTPNRGLPVLAYRKGATLGSLDERNGLCI